MLLTQALRAPGLDRGLSAALERWRSPRAVHGRGKVITDLALALALGEDCLADVAMLRAQPELFGPVASDPVVSRLVTRLAADVPRALKAGRGARAAARRGLGSPLAIMLRPGNAGSNTAADNVAATRLALAQLPAHLRRRVLIRADSGGGTYEFLAWLARPGRRLAYCVGFTMTEDIHDAIVKIPRHVGSRL